MEQALMRAIPVSPHCDVPGLWIRNPWFPWPAYRAPLPSNCQPSGVRDGEIGVTRRRNMTLLCKAAIAVAGVIIGASPSSADALLTHRIPAALAMEAASETVSVCAGHGYRERAVGVGARRWGRHTHAR